MEVQSFDGGGGENEQTVVRVLYSNYGKWENQLDHYDLLYPHVEVMRERAKFHEREVDKTDHREGKYKRDKSFVGPKIGGTSTRNNVKKFDFEYLLDMTGDHILLIQEHWGLEEYIESWKSIAFHKSWHGVWNPAIKTLKQQLRMGALEDQE
eukprot:6231524-Heterocapsa_arctica.AAC.1